MNAKIDQVRVCLSTIRDDLAKAVAEISYDTDGNTVAGPDLVKVMTRAQQNVQTAMLALDDLEVAAAARPPEPLLDGPEWPGPCSVYRDRD